MTLPFRRNWLAEAYMIAQGNQKIKPKREHIQHSLMALSELAKDVQNLRGLMRTAYEEACRRRREQGLPVPPKPPGLDKEDFKWPMQPNDPTIPS